MSALDDVNRAVASIAAAAARSAAIEAQNARYYQFRRRCGGTGLIAEALKRGEADAAFLRYASRSWMDEYWMTQEERVCGG